MFQKVNGNETPGYHAMLFVSIIKPFTMFHYNLCKGWLDPLLPKNTTPASSSEISAPGPSSLAIAFSSSSRSRIFTPSLVAHPSFWCMPRILTLENGYNSRKVYRFEASSWDVSSVSKQCRSIRDNVGCSELALRKKSVSMKSTDIFRWRILGTKSMILLRGFWPSCRRGIGARISRYRSCGPFASSSGPMDSIEICGQLPMLRWETVGGKVLK